MTIEEEIERAHQLCDEINLDEKTRQAMLKAQEEGVSPSTFVFVMLEWVSCVSVYLNQKNDEAAIETLTTLYRTLLTQAFKEKKDGL